MIVGREVYGNKDEGKRLKNITMGKKSYSNTRPIITLGKTRKERSQIALASSLSTRA
jgi:hypothetical protein